MKLVIEDVEKIESISLHTGALTDREFEDLFDRYDEYRVELFSDGELTIVPPVGPETSRQNLKIVRLLDDWARTDGRGLTFESSAYFYLPNGARLSPDACWIHKSRAA